MLKKRIIPCLDIKNGRVVKGVQFEGLKDAGNPLELAQYYSENGADELVFLDISATLENRKTLADLVNQIAHKINIPFINIVFYTLYQFLIRVIRFFYKIIRNITINY